MLINHVCRECGRTFKGGPRAYYCPECRDDRKRKQMNEYHARKRAGAVRKIGSTAMCESCGKPYTVQSGQQRYCPDCAENQIAAKDRQQGLEYYHKNKDWINPIRNLTRSTHVCRICGKVFVGEHKQFYCSPECLKEANRRHAEKWRKDHPGYYKTKK